MIKNIKLFIIFQNGDNKTLKNVPIKINFTKDGYDKIKSVFL